MSTIVEHYWKREDRNARFAALRERGFRPHKTTDSPGSSIKWIVSYHPDRLLTKSRRNK